MAINSITGDSMTSKYGSKEAQKNFEDNFDKIFNQKSALCSICGRDKSTVTECAWTSCPKLWDEARIDVIGSNGNDGLGY
jgi:hypothetical protein